MSGAPYLGTQVSMTVDTSVTTQATIERYQIVQISKGTDDLMQMSVKLCGTSTANRQLACGNAFKFYPHRTQVWETASRPATDISNIDTTKKKKLTIRKNGFSWFKVEVPANGDTVEIVTGDDLYPSIEAEGGVQNLEATTLTASFASADMVTEFALQNRKVARAYSPIIIPPTGASWGGWDTQQPSLGSGTAQTQLVALTNAVTYGYVFGKFEKR